MIFEIRPSWSVAGRPASGPTSRPGGQLVVKSAGQPGSVGQPARWPPGQSAGWLPSRPAAQLTCWLACQAAGRAAHQPAGRATWPAGFGSLARQSPSRRAGRHVAVSPWPWWVQVSGTHPKRTKIQNTNIKMYDAWLRAGQQLSAPWIIGPGPLNDGSMQGFSS